MVFQYDIPLYSNIFQCIPIYSNIFQWCFKVFHVLDQTIPTVPPIDDGPLFPETRHRLRGEILHDAQHVLTTERHSLAYDRSIRCA